MKKFIMIILTAAVAVSISSAAFAAEIPRESVPRNATEESIVITENLIGGILDDVQNGLGYQSAWCRANNAVYNAVLAGNTNGYGYADLAAISRNAILQYRDMYLRPDFYQAAEEKVKVIIADIIEAVENGKDYSEAVRESYIKIYQSVNPDFNVGETFSVDNCYRDMPSVDSALFNRARKLLREAEQRRACNDAN